jgi:hypothetical protein
MDSMRGGAELLGDMFRPLAMTARQRIEKIHFWKPAPELEEKIVAHALGLQSCPFWASGRRDATFRGAAARRMIGVRSARQPVASSWQEGIDAAGGAFDPSDVQDTRNRAVASVVRRPGQSKFRDKLLRVYSARCAISDCTVLEVLEGAHIHPHLGAETDAVTNAILLRCDLHKLLDYGLLAVDEETHEVLLARSLRGSCYEELAGKHLRLPRRKEHWPSAAALAWHRKRCRLVRAS